MSQTGRLRSMTLRMTPIVATVEKFAQLQTAN